MKLYKMYCTFRLPDTFHLSSACIAQQHLTPWQTRCIEDELRGALFSHAACRSRLHAQGLLRLRRRATGDGQYSHLRQTNLFPSHRLKCRSGWRCPLCRCRSPGNSLQLPWLQHWRFECHRHRDLSPGQSPPWLVSTDFLQPSTMIWTVLLFSSCCRPPECNS